MKEKVDIQITVFDETTARYPWITPKKFKVLYDGWRAKGLRLGWHSTSFYTDAWRRGFLAPKDADSLRNYIGIL